MVVERMTDLADSVTQRLLRPAPLAPDRFQQVPASYQLTGRAGQAKQYLNRFWREMTGPGRAADLALERLNEKLAQIEAV